MGKKSKKGNSKINYQVIETSLEKGNYRLAASLIRGVKFPPQEKKKGNQLNVDIHFHWALDLFNKGEYTQAISTLRMFVERFKKKVNLPLEKSDVLLGLSYLYLNNWEKAALYLQKSNSQSSTKAFYFYYLLALIYQKKYQDIDSLLAAHQAQIDSLSEARKQYLSIAFALVDQNFEQAKTLLGVYTKGEETDKAISTNIEALEAIILEKEYKQDDLIKVSYKFVLDLPLTSEETTYLETIPQIEASTKELKKGQLKDVLKEVLHQLCEEGESLTEEEFKACMDLPEAYRPYIVYNQIAALFNEGIEDTEERIIALLRKYQWHFFQVPESVFLFAQIVYWDQDNFTPTAFWKAVETSLDRFGKSFTPMQLNRLSWRMLGCLEYGNFTKEKLYINQRARLVKAYPQMVGLKFNQLLDYILDPKVELAESALDVFTFSGFNYGDDIAKEILEDSLEELIGFADMNLRNIGFLDSMERHHLNEQLDKMYQRVTDKVFTAFIRTTTEQEVHLKNRVVLDLFNIANSFLKSFHSERPVKIDKEKQKAFADAYYQVLVLFEEDTPDSEYYEYYQSHFVQ